MSELTSSRQSDPAGLPGCDDVTGPDAPTRERVRPAYRTIVADPPWDQGSGGPRNGNGWNGNTDRPSAMPYDVMPLRKIRALPVRRMAAADAHLYLWTTQRYLRRSFNVAEVWGFVPSTVLTWCKPPRGLGMGGTFTATTEFVLFCRRGTLAAERRVDTTWFAWQRGAHSAKPEAFLDLVESVSPGPYLELFARRQRLGWDTWGNEALEHITLDGLAVHRQETHG